MVLKPAASFSKQVLWAAAAEKPTQGKRDKKELNVW